MEKQLTADLNVVANSNLEIQLLDGDLNIIQKLDDEPNDVGGLTSAELKAKFDESGNIIKKYINETLIPAVLTDDATEESRKQAEAARVAAEQGRVTAEEGRVSAETARAAAEQARSEAESSRVSAENAREAAETARADETAGIVARATGQANAAASSASQAAVSEQGARDAAGTANNAAYTANGAAAAASSSAAQAQSSAAAAAQSAASVDGINKTAQSWAVGGTNTRPGEDTDNAKYWAQQAQIAVGGDFATKTEAQGYVTAHNESNVAHPDLRGAVAGSVRYDAAQSLTDEQKAQARANINAAPGGHGLGDTIIPEAPDYDANKIATTGWYMASVNVPTSSGGWWLISSITYGNVKYQFAYANESATNILNGSVSQRSQKNASSGWTPWEYVNPPMQLGVEYRTTERYFGKPVYVKIVDFGVLPANSKKVVAHGIDNLGYVLDYAGSAGYWAWPTIPHVTDVQFTATNIEVTTDVDLGGFATKFILKYFKTTD